jgi:hypothetical protein
MRNITDIMTKIEELLMARQRVRDSSGTGKEIAINAPVLLKTEGQIQALMWATGETDRLPIYPDGGTEKSRFKISKERKVRGWLGRGLRAK